MEAKDKALFVERTKKITGPLEGDGAVEGKTPVAFKHLLREIHLGTCC